MAKEQARVHERFESAVELAEQAFATELQRLTAHLAERLTGLHDAPPKVFRDSAVENLREFFERFRRLNIRSSPELGSGGERRSVVATLERGLTGGVPTAFGSQPCRRCCSPVARSPTHQSREGVQGCQRPWHPPIRDALARYHPQQTGAASHGG